MYKKNDYIVKTKQITTNKWQVGIWDKNMGRFLSDRLVSVENSQENVKLAIRWYWNFLNNLPKLGYSLGMHF